MAHIYRNSSVTISGSNTSDSNVGFLHKRESPQPVPHVWEYRNAEEAEHKRATLRDISYEYPAGPYLTRKEKASPLQQRAWILQEQLLSPRLLYFGLYRMYWECNTCLQFENLLFPRQPFDSGLHCTVSKASIMPVELASQPAQPFQWKEWYAVVQDYSLRSLTKSMDKLPALSGIADWLLGGCQDNYLAGLLKHALHAGLIWRIDSNSDLKQQVSGYRGPSWSWVSTDYPVTFSALEPPEKAAPSNFDLAWWIKMCDSISRKTKMHVHDAHVELQGLNPFGEVKSASIKLRARVKTGIIIWATGFIFHTPFHIIDPKGSEVLNSQFFTDDEVLNGQFFPDDLHRWRLLVKEEQERQRSRVRHRLDEETFSHCSISATVNADTHEDSSPNSLAEAPEKQYNSSIPLRKLECLCIDVVEDSRSWHALAIEPLALEDVPPRLEFGSNNEIYKPYRRIGAVADFKCSDIHWFEDGQWELIELF
jgi:hypothetical protein